MNTHMNKSESFLQKLGRVLGLQAGAAGTSDAMATDTHVLGTSAPKSHVQAVAELSEKKPACTAPEDEAAPTNETSVEVEIDDDEEDDESEDLALGTEPSALTSTTTPPTGEGDAADDAPPSQNTSSAGADSGAEISEAGAPPQEEDTMAENQNQGASASSTRANAGGNGAAAGAPENPPTKKASMAELKAAFPADRDFACECFEKGMTLPEAKAAKYDLDQAKAAEQAKVGAALGNNGKGAKAPAFSTREGATLTGHPATDRAAAVAALAGNASSDPRGKLIAAGLMDPIMGKVGAVPQADGLDYDGVLGVYMAAGLNFNEANREAQTHHRDKWDAKREQLAESYSSFAANRENRARAGASR